MARKKQSEEDVDDLLEELDEVSDEEDEFEEEPDAKPTKSKRSKAKKAAKPKKEREGIGTNEVAAEAGIDSRKLRMLLRAEFPREEGGRYQWKSLNDPEVKAILKRIRAGGANEAQQKSLDKVKGKKKTSKKKKGSRKRKSSDDE